MNVSNGFCYCWVGGVGWGAGGGGAWVLGDTGIVEQNITYTLGSIEV